MLRDLLAREPASKHECVAGIDDIIEYLERNMSVATEFHGFRDHQHAPMSAKPRLQ